MADPTDRAVDAGAETAEDDRLVEAARNGEVRAFDALLDRHQARVLRVLRLLAVPLQDRDDVAQEVFIRVFRHLGGFRAGHSFGAWLYRVTVNAAHDYRTRRGRAAEDEAPWSDGLDVAAGEGSAPGEGLRRRDLQHVLEHALASLTERERAVFVLRELEQLSTRQVARILGITSITVRRHVSLARRRLRGCLAEPGSRQEHESEEPGPKKDRLAVERLAPDRGSTQ